MKRAKTASEPEPRYRWDSPAEWLLEKIDRARPAEVVGIAKELIGHLDNDRIQDSFQSEMSSDGYFRDLNKCPDCETILTKAGDDSTTLPPNYCVECDREIGEDE